MKRARRQPSPFSFWVALNCYIVVLVPFSIKVGIDDVGNDSVTAYAVPFQFVDAVDEARGQPDFQWPQAAVPHALSVRCLSVDRHVGTPLGEERYAAVPRDGEAEQWQGRCTVSGDRSFLSLYDPRVVSADLFCDLLRVGSAEVSAYRFEITPDRRELLV
jgi:hypothetical protein